MMQFSFQGVAELQGKIVNEIEINPHVMYTVTIEEVKAECQPVSKSQRGALHLFLLNLSDELNAKGYDQRDVYSLMNENAEMPWNSTMVKENMWRRMQKVVAQKDSSESLTSDDYGKIYDTLKQWLMDKGLPCPEWPSRWN